MYDKFLNVLTELESFRKIKELLENENKSNRKTALLTGVVDSQKCHLSCALCGESGRPMVFIAQNELKAREIYGDLSFFYPAPGQVKYYPVKDIIFYSADVKSADITKQRFDVISSLLDGDAPRAIVLSVEALFDRLTEKHIFRQFILELSVGDTLEPDTLVGRLLNMGYERADIVEGPGQFARRGGIIDFFTTVCLNPVRLEFWGDQIDSIRLIDPVTQRSAEKLENVRVFPVRELVFDESSAERASRLIRGEFDETYEKYMKKGMNDEAQTLKETTLETLERLADHKTFSGADKYSCYFFDAKTTLLDYLPENAVLFFDEPQRIAAQAEMKTDEFYESFKSRIEKGSMLPGQLETAVSYAEIQKKAKNFTQILLAAMAASGSASGFTVNELVSFTVKSSGIIQNRVDLLFDDIKFLLGQQYRIVILAGGAARGRRLAGELAENGFPAEYHDDLNEAELAPGKVTLAPGSLAKGFEYPLIRLSVICGADIFGAKKQKKRFAKKSKGSIESFSDLSPGDYVVHISHGVGIYKGIEKITAENISRDYLKITYADGGNLFISTTQLDSIQKYIGGQDAKPKLNKLGGQEFAKAKARAKGAAAKIAKELTELYARREMARGYTYSRDTVWQEEFEEAFPYEETEDQLSAVADIKRDMESGRVMDRLVCGDVGYGKTEVAIRAAFKTVMEGRQAAYLVPTTILAQQHFNTFSQRMKDFPVTVGLLSRFRTPRQQKETVDGLKNGSTDIVIGTHRLLSKDLGFKNLGLVIVDEEQRFGVTHKEKLKKLKENVNVLTLTATPIPRTLHMSLSGIRDMSVLDEPPLERQPVQTYVMEYNPEFVKDAVKRELVRGGQVYYLHNRVKNIAETASKIARLVPEASVAYAHGQMSERELENVMMDFIAGEIDVLVCTTIIETGLDIQNVNTIIIQDADFLGLAQLYQLRGRVGRSNRIAYCYLMYRKDKVLTEASEKRLQTIREFTEFGSGFKIAMRDLSMRGAGSILGAEQHGHMDAVGYEMYLKLLEEAVHEYRGEPVDKEFETQIDVSVNAYIPSFYIEDEIQKLDVYRKISLIRGEDDYFDIFDEITDRFGDPPASVRSLLEIALLKAAAHSADAVSVIQKGSTLVTVFLPDAGIMPERISESVKKHKGRLMFTVAHNPYLTYKISGVEAGVKELRSILEEMAGKTSKPQTGNRDTH